MVPHLRNLNYKERLAAIGIPTLEERRVRGDIIQMNKINSKINQIRLHALLDTGQCPSTWIYHPQISAGGAIDSPDSSAQLNQEKTFLQIDVSTLWNELSDDVINAASINAFKSKYDKFS